MNLAHDLFHQLQEDKRGFELLSDYLRQTAGISLPLNNKNLCLMASRLAKVCREFHLESYSEIYKKLRKGDLHLKKEFVMALTTNTTHFFRESRHFEVLTQEMGRLSTLDSQDTDLRIWCAASSTGQEPYTLAMTCLDYFEKNRDGDFRILGTDIDREVLQKAAAGYYAENEITNLENLKIKKYFELNKTSKGDFYRVRRNLADHVTFAPLNLLESHFPFKRKFHAIFARNVFIYFERELIDSIIEHMSEYLYPGGLLFLGHSESGTMHSDKFITIEHSVYRKKEAA